MKRILISSLFGLFTIVIQAQNEVKNDSVVISNDTIIQTQQPKEKTVEEKLSEAEETNAKYLIRMQEELSQKKTELIGMNSKYSDLEKKYNELAKHSEIVDKQLISCASNYLYLPFNAYYVKEFAIAAYELVSDKALYSKYIIRLNLLKGYESHIRELIAFMIDKEKKCHDPFQKEAKEFVPELKSLACYQSYSRYEGFKDTYLGAKLVEIERRLNAQKSSSRASFKDIVKELNTCLKTLEDL